jgi:predicted RNA-binding Zn-ribbon protein involved in translation (DUF1610 family)
MVSTDLIKYLDGAAEGDRNVCMSDFELNCPHCNQLLTVSEEMLGSTFVCTSCNKTMELPPAPKTKECPFCGEDILFKAKKCKHCGEILDASLKMQRRFASGPTQPSVAIPGQVRPAPGNIIVKTSGEGCFLQTLNVGCAIIFSIIVIVIVIIFIVIFLH